MFEAHASNIFSFTLLCCEHFLERSRDQIIEVKQMKTKALKVVQRLLNGFLASAFLTKRRPTVPCLDTADSKHEYVALRHVFSYRGLALKNKTLSMLPSL